MLDPAYQQVASTDYFVMIYHEEDYARSTAPSLLRIAIELRKPIMMFADPTAQLPEEFIDYTGKKALVTEQLGTVQAHYALIRACFELGVDPVRFAQGIATWQPYT